MYDPDSFDKTKRFLHGHNDKWLNREKNPKRLVSYDHSNPNNDRKSPCKYIEVDNNIFWLDEAYIELVL